MKLRTLLLAGAALVAIGTNAACAQSWAVAPATPAPATSAPAVTTPAIPAPAASGQAVTPAQQAVLEAQLKSWYGLGAVAPAAAPFKVTPAGDHFDVVAPLRLRGQGRGEMQITGQATPGDNGKWTYTNVKTSTPFQMVLDMPVPPADGQKGPAKTVPVTYDVNAASQDGTLVWDPSFATPSSMTTAFKGMTIAAHGAGLEQMTTIDSVDSHSTITPVQGSQAQGSPPQSDLVDIATLGTLTGYRLDSKAGTGAVGGTPAIQASIDKIGVTGGMTGVSREHATMLVHVLGKIGALSRTAPGATPKHLPPELLAELTAAMQNLGSTLNISETFDTVAMNVGGMAFTLDQVKLGVDGKADQGLVQAGLDMGVTGLKLPALGLGDMEKLIPHQVTLHPYVSGIGVNDLVKLLAAANENRNPTPAEINAMFSHGGVVTGLDHLTLDIGGATFQGAGKLMVTDPQTMAGTARITAENFDALVQTLGAIPMARQAIPVAIFLKGIGKADAGKLAWDVNYADGKVLVNNIDVLAMAGGGPVGIAPSAPPGAPSGAAPRAPAGRAPTPQQPNHK